MTSPPVDLTIELRSAEGTSTECCQADEERIQKTLRLLAAPRNRAAIGTAAKDAFGLPLSECGTPNQLR